MALPFLLVACGSVPSKVQTVTVKVPVAVVPAPPEHHRPKLESENISIKSNGYDGYVKALEGDMVRMENYTTALENIIDTYDRMSKQLDNVKEPTNGSSK